MLNIGIDVDGTIKMWAEKLEEVYKKDFPNHWYRPVNEQKTYKTSNHYELGDGIFKYFQDTRANEIYLGAKPYPGAVEFMREMTGKAYITIVTKQPSTKLDILTLNWLTKNQIAFDEIRYTQDKSKINGLDVILDDCTENLVKISQENMRTNRKNVFPMCMDRPWNQDWDGLRVKSYDDFLKFYGMKK